MPKAWIEPEGYVKDVAPGNPHELYHPAVAVFYDTDVPEGTVNGAQLIDGAWVNPTPPAPPEATPPQPWQSLPVHDFLALLTLDEEAEISTSADPVVTVFYRRLTTAPTVERSRVIAGLDHLVSVGILTQSRVDEILAGTAPN